MDDSQSLPGSFPDSTKETRDGSASNSIDYLATPDPENPFANIMGRLHDEYTAAGGKLGFNDQDDDKEFAWLKQHSTKYIRTFRTNVPSEILNEVKPLLKKQRKASSYKEWLNISIQLDAVLENERWKNETETDMYDYNAVQNQLMKLREVHKAHDWKKMLYIIRTCWRRNFAGIDNPQLYQCCYVGTKKLIEEYLSECQKCLIDLCSPECPLNDDYVLEMLIQTRKNYGQIAVTMSGGGTFGLAGIGVFAALFENEIYPRMISGSSCGSIMSALICCKHDDELLDILGEVFSTEFKVFGSKEHPESILTCLGRFMKYGVFFDNQGLTETITKLVGDITFREAFNKTGRILNITVSPASIHDQPTLLNYLTAPNVMIRSAICASCSLPLIFSPSAIFEKDPLTGEQHQWSNPMVKFVDGSVNGDLPITRLSEMFNVNHVIAFQANPHVLPLVRFSQDCDRQCNQTTFNALLRNSIKKSFNTTCWEFTHAMDVLQELGVFPNLCTKFKQLVIQPYSGDITILPNIQMKNLSVLFINPTSDFFWNCILWGARATWPQMQIIKDHCSIEFALDKAITELKSRTIGMKKDLSKMTLLERPEDVRSLDYKYRKNRRENRMQNRSESVSYYHFQEGNQATPEKKKRQMTVGGSPNSISNGMSRGKSEQLMSNPFNSSCVSLHLTPSSDMDTSSPIKQNRRYSSVQGNIY